MMHVASDLRRARVDMWISIMLLVSVVAASAADCCVHLDLPTNKAIAQRPLVAVASAC